MSTAPASSPSRAEASRELLRDSVFDAVGELLAVDTWQGVTMGDIASRAGVSRQTLYNAFGGREELAAAYLMREAERFLAAIEGAVTENADDPRAALRSAAELFLSLAGSHPLVRAATSGDGDELVPLATTRGGELLREMTARLASLLRANWPELDRTDVFLAAETLVRLAISHAVLPTGSAAATAEELTRVLGPFIDGVLADAGTKLEPR